MGDDAKLDVDRYISGPARPGRRLMSSKTHQLMTSAALDHHLTCRTSVYEAKSDGVVLTMSDLRR